MKKSKMFDPILIHTGQHYDYELSKIFFRDLELPKPDINLKVGSMNRGQQIQMIKKLLVCQFMRIKPALVVVVGDVNSTLAAAQAAKKCKIRIAHVESGLRSGDLTMPEERNRIETDKISDFLFVTEPSGLVNLKNEKITKKKWLVGNTMIDTLVHHRQKINNSRILKKHRLLPQTYSVLTLHRPSNVDSKVQLKRIFAAFGLLNKPTKRMGSIVFPVHPRTREALQKYNIKKELREKALNIHFIKPLGYVDFLKLVKESGFVMTDSGGIQEEATHLNVPCITLRKTTERPITVQKGTNTMVDPEFVESQLPRQIEKIMPKKARRKKKGIALWDGKAAQRIVSILTDEFANKQT